MKKTFYFFNIILAILIVIGDICYSKLGGLWVKSVTSAGFVLLGIVNLVYIIKNKSDLKKYAWFMLSALVLCMAGDVVINIEFMAGAIIFALGHMFYYIAYSIDQKFNFIDLIPTLIIFIPSCLVITLVPSFDFGGIVMEIVCIIYALIISFMVGKAISNLIKERNLSNLLLVVGSVLFFFSDLMLLIDQFGSNAIIFDTLCLATYYPGQILIAYSIFNKEVEKSELIQKE